MLLVDDEPSIRLGIGRFLKAKGFEVEEAGDCKAAEEAFTKSPPDLVIVDQQLPDGYGVDLLPRLRALGPGVPVVFLTGHGSIELAVRAIKEGAEQFLTKPVDLQAVVVIVERLLEERRNRQKQLAGQARRGRGPVNPFLGTGAAIGRLAEEAARVLEIERPVLIQGETGSGKGLLARWLHDNGPRRQEAFVDINCAGLSRDLLESELLGHEAGAFTGALKSKDGLLDVAHRGTLFLDEIGDMDLSIQPKLLKVLEEQRFRRLGDVRDRHVDVRLIAATHQDLAQLIREKKFREDLLFRISTLPLVIPPLRERPEDIAVLARHFADEFAAELGLRGVTLSDEALAQLSAYHWPGNLRELRNVLERSLLVGDREIIRPRDLRFGVAGDREEAEGSPLPTLEEVERRHISRVLEIEGGNVERTARRLGVSTSSLYERLKKYGIRRSGK